jgi:3-deoxy-D-manno-octulosonic-acid transferase
VRFIYTLLGYVLLAPLFCAVMFFRGLRDKRYWENFGERFGTGPTADKPSIWVHAVSVGEVQACAVLVRCLHDRYPGIPIVVTTLTATGAERARALLADRATVRYMPLDLPGSVGRFLDRVRPRIAVIFETEIWPNLYHECGHRRVPIVMASARLSPRAMGKYTSFLTVFRQAMSTKGLVIAAQGEADAARFRELGANPQKTHVTGNL